MITISINAWAVLEETKGCDRECRTVRVSYIALANPVEARDFAEKSMKDDAALECSIAPCEIKIQNKRLK